MGERNPYQEILVQSHCKVQSGLKSNSKQEWDDRLPITRVVRKAFVVPSVPLVCARKHQQNFREEKQIRWRKRSQQHSEGRERRRRRGSEREAKPLAPLAEVVRVRDEAVQVPVRDGVVLLLVLSPAVVVGFRLALRLGGAADVEQHLVVHDVPDEACGPEADARPEGRARERACEERLCARRGEIRAKEEAVHDVEEHGGERDADVRLGARGRAERRDDRAVEIVGQEERGEEAGGMRERQGWVRGGCEGRVQVRVAEHERRDKLHEHPGLDACTRATLSRTTAPDILCTYHRRAGCYFARA